MMIRTLFLIAMLCSSPLWAAGLSTVGTSTVAMGTGGTGSANADDPGAAYINPAATASFEGFRSSVGFIGISPTLTATNPRLSYSTTPSFAAPPHIHADLGVLHLPSNRRRVGFAAVGTKLGAALGASAFAHVSVAQQGHHSGKVKKKLDSCCC